MRILVLDFRTFPNAPPQFTPAHAQDTASSDTYARDQAPAHPRAQHHTLRRASSLAYARPHGCPDARPSARPDARAPSQGPPPPFPSELFANSAQKIPQSFASSLLFPASTTSLIIAYSTGTLYLA
jgi:hypothetical protein